MQDNNTGEVRLIRGRDCFWALGTQRVARLPLDCVGADGRLTPAAAEAIDTAALSPAVSRDLFHITIVVTTQCNLACAYCFQNTVLPAPGRVGTPDRIPQVSLAENDVPRILKFAAHRMQLRGATRLDVMLFGGEPMLRLGACERLLSGAQELGLVSASMISNGTLLTRAGIERLVEVGLGSAQITFDGDLPVHDRTRITIAGRGTFDQIVDNLADSQDLDLRWNLRINLTGESLENTRSLLDRLAGRLDVSRFSVSFALVNDAGIGFPDTLTGTAELGRRVAQFAMHAMDLGFSMPLPAARQCLACGEAGGGTGAVINADGALYSCWESAGQEGYRVGSVDSGYLEPEIVEPRWVSCGYSASWKPDETYQDTVSEAILDRLYRNGGLGRAIRERRLGATH